MTIKQIDMNWWLATAFGRDSCSNSWYTGRSASWYQCVSVCLARCQRRVELDVIRQYFSLWDYWVNVPNPRLDAIKFGWWAGGYIVAVGFVVSGDILYGDGGVVAVMKHLVWPSPLHYWMLRLQRREWNISPRCIMLVKSMIRGLWLDLKMAAGARWSLWLVNWRVLGQRDVGDTLTDALNNSILQCIVREVISESYFHLYHKNGVLYTEYRPRKWIKNQTGGELDNHPLI